MGKILTHDFKRFLKKKTLKRAKESYSVKITRLSLLRPTYEIEGTLDSIHQFWDSSSWDNMSRKWRLSSRFICP